MRTLALALTLVLSLSISVPARAAVDETNANRLNALGLFLGTGSGYDLGGSATRLHGIIMLTRMLGEEDAALSFDGPCPFSDVAAAPPRWPLTAPAPSPMWRRLHRAGLSGEADPLPGTGADDDPANFYPLIC